MFGKERLYFLPISNIATRERVAAPISRREIGEASTPETKKRFANSKHPFLDIKDL
jgi:hypothetical protein